MALPRDVLNHCKLYQLDCKQTFAEKYYKGSGMNVGDYFMMSLGNSKRNMI